MHGENLFDLIRANHLIAPHFDEVIIPPLVIIIPFFILHGHVTRQEPALKSKVFLITVFIPP